MAQVIFDSTANVHVEHENEDSRRLKATPRMALKSALFLVVLALCAQPGESTTNVMPHSLRGRHHRHHRHHHHGHRLSNVQVPSYDDLHPKVEKKLDPLLIDPLYDDFLHIMNRAARQALDEQRGVPKYGDFLDALYTGADKASKQQASSASYDQFLAFMKKKTDEAYHQQVELPTYDDFLAALKKSVMVALKQPSPKYADFLNTLEAGAEQAMQKRVFHELNETTIKALAKHHQKKRQNPLDKIVGKAQDDLKKAEKQIKGKKNKDETSKLRNELRELQEEKKRHAAQGGNPSAKKPLMQRINVLRTQLCWKRPNLWQHEKCLRFLGIHCMKESTGQGICREFTHQANAKCKTETDPRWREDYCALGEALSDTYGDEDEDGSSGDQALEGEGEDDVDDDLGSDDDLDKDLMEEDKEMEEQAAKDKVEGAEAMEGEGEDKVVEEDGKGGKKEETLAGAADGKGKGEGKDGEGQGGADGKAGEGAGADGKGADGKEGADDSGASGKEGAGADGEGADAAGGEAGAGKGKDAAGDSTVDTDGDGVVDSEDAFANDPNEWKDTDGDGVGDNADKDIDGDGRDNAVDVFPADKNEWQDTDRDGIGDNADKDRDGDSFPNEKDKFPDDPTEWLDSDGDGVGDNKDAYPYNPNCHSPTEPCEDVSKHGAPKPGSDADPTTLDMDALRALPTQGYNEALEGTPPLVNHNNYYTWVSDWQDEWPEMQETEKQTMTRICKEHPRNIWCFRFRNHDAHFR